VPQGDQIPTETIIGLTETRKGLGKEGDPGAEGVQMRETAEGKKNHQGDPAHQDSLTDSTHISCLALLIVTM